MTYKAGDSFFIEAGKIHEGINKGTSLIKAVATFVVEKGKPLRHREEAAGTYSAALMPSPFPKRR